MAVNSVIAQKMTQLNNVVKAVANKFSNDPNYTVFLDFRLNDLHINCTSKDVNQNLLMSFEQSNNGSGQANTFRIQICYAPQLGEDFDINTVDRAILKATSSIGDISTRYCTLQYGYGDTTDGTFRTKQFEGLVIDYTCEIQDGLLIYDISGYSGLFGVTESKDPVVVSVGTPDGTGEVSVRPTDAVKSIVDNYLQGQLDSSIVYDFKIDDRINSGDYADVEVYIPTQVDKNPCKAISDILAKAVSTKDWQKIQDGKNVSEYDKVVYSWFISEDRESENAIGTLWITFTDPTAEQSADADLVFNWMSPGGPDEVNHLVINFKPEFQGSVLLGRAKAQLNGSKEVLDNKTDKEIVATYIGLNDGSIGQIENSTSPPAGGDIDIANSEVEAEKASWVQAVQYPYKATMTTVGIPYSIPITGRIKIVPLIYGQPHFSSGTYIVLQTRDVISSGGVFTTEWNLLKETRIEELQKDKDTKYTEPQDKKESKKSDKSDRPKKDNHTSAKYDYPIGPTRPNNKGK